MTAVYPAEPAEAGLGLFLEWFGRHYARSTAVVERATVGAVAHASVTVGREWPLDVTVLNTLAAGTTVAWEASRAAVEQRLDSAGYSVALWVPRGAPLPTTEPALSELVLAVEEAARLPDGRRELRRPVTLSLRRVSTTGSVVTVLGGLSAEWAQFTNRVPGSFQLNSAALFRLTADEDGRAALMERIVLAAGQPDVDDSLTVPAEDCWTLNDLPGGRSCVLGSPLPETDEQSASLRRTVRALLREAAPALDRATGSKALLIMGAATYAEQEKLSWTLRGMDPALYSGYDLLAVLADGIVRPLLQPGRNTLPWDAPLPA